MKWQLITADLISLSDNFIRCPSVTPGRERNRELETRFILLLPILSTFNKQKESETIFQNNSAWETREFFAFYTICNILQLFVSLPPPPHKNSNKERHNFSFMWEYLQTWRKRFCCCCLQKKNIANEF